MEGLSKEVKLKVAEVRDRRDVGHWKARIDAKIMEFLEVTPGDVVEIEGKRTTAAVAWPAHHEDAGENIIRIDEISRNNAEVSINGYVLVRKAVVREAQSITLAPVRMTIPSVDQSFYEFIKNRILEAPLVAGDTIQVSIFGSGIGFQVTKTIPHGIVVIKPETDIQVLSEPISEMQVTPEVRIQVTRVEDLDYLSVSLERKELEVLFDGNVKVTCKVYLNYGGVPSEVREGVFEFYWKEENLPELDGFLKALDEVAQKELKAAKDRLTKILTLVGPVTINMGKLFGKLLTSLKNELPK